MKRRKTMAENSYTWNKKSAGAAISRALETLSARYPALAPDAEGATELVFRKGEDASLCSAVREEGKVVITYGKANMALRMVGAVLADTVPAQPDRCPFKTFGVMIDASRNSVMTVAYLKSYLDRLAILGYDTVMLYTEETYRLPGEPLFGFMRGAYTRDELREIDRYAARLGIEVIPCIQTLGHLAQMFRWGNYAEINDKAGILLVDEPKTYALIEKMLVFWKGALRSRRIHLGMDEAWGLGTGKYSKLHGKKPAFDIINGHLKKVCALCDKHGFRPMIWSDMYFRIGSKTHAYYDLESQPPPEVVADVPEGLQLVYWDYYHNDKAFYSTFIEKHRAVAGDPLVASGVWTWNKFWYDQFYTRSTVAPCVEACREAGLDEFVLTMWGDCGGFCDYDSAMAGLAYSAELAFAGHADETALGKRVAGLFRGAPYKAISALGELMAYEVPPYLFDDPVMLFFTKGMKNLKEEIRFHDGVFNYATLARDFKAVKKLLDKTPVRGDCGDIRLARALATAVVAKLDWAEAVFAMGGKKDMRKSVEKALPLAKAYRKAFRNLCGLVRTMWHAHNKPFGLESIQIHLAGQAARCDELVRRLEDFLAGDEKVFPEFAELDRAGEALRSDIWMDYRSVASATTIF